MAENTAAGELAGWSGSCAGLRPSAWADALIERVGSQVGTAGPDGGSGLGVNLDLGEAIWRAGVFEDRPRMRSSTSTSPCSPSAKVSRRTPWRTTSARWYRGLGRSSQWLDLQKCLTGSRLAPVLFQRVLVELCPGKDESELPASEIAVHDL